jgi:hypothetical protein
MLKVVRWDDDAIAQDFFAHAYHASDDVIAGDVRHYAFNN